MIERGASTGFKVLRLLCKTTSNAQLLPRHAKNATKCALEKLIFSAGESSSSLMTSFRKNREPFSSSTNDHITMKIICNYRGFRSIRTLVLKSSNQLATRQSRHTRNKDESAKICGFNQLTVFTLLALIHAYRQFKRIICCLNIQ